MANGFDGPLGTVTATVMARRNADMEHAAVARLGPAAGRRVLVVGCGPGVGVGALLDAGATAVTAVDPSAAMLAAVRRRLAPHPLAGRVSFQQVAGHLIEGEPGTFDGATAVNSHQLWAPRAATTQRIAALLRPGAPLVALTHTWAVERHQPLAVWLAEVEAELEEGFTDLQVTRGRYRSGEAVELVAVRRPPP